MENSQWSVPVDMDKKEFIKLELDKKYNVDYPLKMYVNKNCITMFFEDSEGDCVVVVKNGEEVDNYTYVVIKECFERLVQELV